MKISYPLAIAVAAITVLSTGMSVSASDTDARIESSFKNSFVYKTYLSEDDISISSKEGVVVLTGDVVNKTHRPMAQDTAEALPGVKSVDNRIEVKGEQPSEFSDVWVGTKIKTMLLFHRNVSASKTEVYVLSGVVTLKGEASSQAQLDLTSEYVGDVEGVKEVINEMTVVVPAPEEPEQTMMDVIDDASITAQVKAALLMHRSTSALSTKVTSNDGVVTVSGVAENEAEKSLVNKLSGDINGVKSVVNNMTIEEEAPKN